MTRNGIDILLHPAESTETNIRYELPMEELIAAKEANLNLVSWMRGEYSIDEMTTVIAWNRLNNLVKMHSADAEIKSSRNKTASEKF